MIQANELKRFNIVNNGIENIVIDSIEFSDVDNKWYVMYDDFCASEWLEDCEPIPLDEEWFLKFDITKMPLSEYTISTYDFLGFKLWHNDNKFQFSDRIEIKYVHQLQNLYFALTNKELQLKTKVDESK